MSPPTRYVPDRGDVVWIDFDPSAGREQSGHRPALVLSRRNYNARTGLAVVCPISRRGKGYTSEFPLPAGLPVTGVVLADHVKNQDWTVRRAVFVCRLDDRLVQSVADAVAAFLN